ncbi:MAG TPA: class I SAM-dependent methyltransferase [Desulfobulbus sp.]|nr:class I SAM-dependent methyltransferase [Desulfobulbus sp.]
MNTCSREEERRIQHRIKNNIVLKRKRQNLQETLRILAEVGTGGQQCKKLQIRCGGTFGLYSDVMVIQEGEVTGFRNLPDFDFVFFTFAIGQQPGPDMVNLFQYCRMLLKPGGTLALLLPDEKKRPRHHFFSTFFMSIIGIRSGESSMVDLLQNSGLVNVHEKKVTRCGVIVTGNRPVPYSGP